MKWIVPLKLGNWKWICMFESGFFFFFFSLYIFYTGEYILDVSRQSDSGLPERLICSHMHTHTIAFGWRWKWKRVTDADFLLQLCLSGQDIPGQTWVTCDMALSDSKVSADLIPSVRTKPVSTQQLRCKQPVLWKNAILLLSVETQRHLFPPSTYPHNLSTSHSCTLSFLHTVKLYARSLCNLRVAWRTVWLATDDLMFGLRQPFFLE